MNNQTIPPTVAHPKSTGRAHFGALALTALLSGAFVVPTALATSATSVVQKDKKERKAPKGHHFDTRYGFQFKQPKKWDNIAIKVEEEWLAAKYVSQSEYHYYDKEIGRGYSHNPEVSVIVFPHKVMKEKTKVDESDDGDKVTFTIKNPYKDYDDFLSRTYSGGGYYKSAEEEDEINDLKVTKLTYLVEKLTSSGPQTISTWIYHADDADYAVQIVGLTEHWKKVKSSSKLVRSTFKLIERDGPLSHSGNTADGVTFSRLGLSGKDKKENKSNAQKSEKVMHERAIAKLPPKGWEHSKKGRALTLFSAEKKFSNRVERHTNALLDWLDDSFGFLGADAYMREPIVRICKNIDEAAAYTAGVSSGGYGGTWNIDDELVTWKGGGGWTGNAIDRLNSQIYRYWMLEKNFALSTAMPEWIDIGLENLVKNARMDNRKVDWRYDASVINAIQTAKHYDTVIPIQELFLMTSKEFNEAQKDDQSVNPWAAGAVLINYLASPEIRRHRLAKGLLENYLRNMVTVVDEVEKEAKKELDAARRASEKNDDEADYIARRRAIFAEKEKDLLQRTFDLTFGEFDESDWKALNKSFLDTY